MDRNLHNFALVVFDGLDVVRRFGHWGTHCRFAARNRSLSSCKAVRWSPPLAPRPTDVGWRLTFIETWKLGGIDGVPNSTYAALRSRLPCHDKLCIKTVFPCSRRACLRPALKPIRWPIPALPSRVWPCHMTWCPGSGPCLRARYLARWAASRTASTSRSERTGRARQRSLSGSRARGLCYCF